MFWIFFYIYTNYIYITILNFNVISFLKHHISFYQMFAFFVTLCDTYFLHFFMINLHFNFLLLYFYTAFIAMQLCKDCFYISNFFIWTCIHIITFNSTPFFKKLIFLYLRLATACELRSSGLVITTITTSWKFLCK